jgi:hypothetical protein
MKKWFNNIIIDIATQRKNQKEVIKRQRIDEKKKNDKFWQSIIEQRNMDHENEIRRLVIEKDSEIESLQRDIDDYKNRVSEAERIREHGMNMVKDSVIVGVDLADQAQKLVKISTEVFQTVNIIADKAKNNKRKYLGEK